MIIIIISQDAALKHTEHTEESPIDGLYYTNTQKPLNYNNNIKKWSLVSIWLNFDVEWKLFNEFSENFDLKR